MRKLTFICCTISLLLALPANAWCARSPFCRLGSKSVDLMNGILFSPGKIPPVVLVETLAFAEECPADVVPAFREFADNEQELHRSWIEALKVEAGESDKVELRELLWLTQQKLDRSRSSATRAYFDDVFSAPSKIPKGHQIRIECLFERISLMALGQYPHTDGAGRFDQSDFLLFLLAIHPVPFLKAVRKDQRDTSTWLSQLGAMSFAGLPSERNHREKIKELLLETISNIKLPELAPEQRRLETALRATHFRAYR